MDRDPSENVVSAEDRTTPTSGQSSYGSSGAERAREAAERERQRPRDEGNGGGLVPGTRSEPGAVDPVADQGHELPRGDDKRDVPPAPTTPPPPD